MIEHLISTAFFAGIAALVSFAFMAFSKKAKGDHHFALWIQSGVILGLGLLYFLGAGLQSPPGYPHWLIPIVFMVVLAVAHLIWRAAFPNEGQTNGR